MCPNPKVFDVIVGCLLKVAGYGSGLVGVGAGEKPIAQAGNAIFHVHYELLDGTQCRVALYGLFRRCRRLYFFFGLSGGFTLSTSAPSLLERERYVLSL